MKAKYYIVENDYKNRTGKIEVEREVTFLKLTYCQI